MAFDNSCNFLVINRGKRRVLVQARSDAFIAVKTMLIIKDGCDSRTNNGIGIHL
nr:hypothetical protein [Corynebacterium macginleyi]